MNESTASSNGLFGTTITLRCALIETDARTNVSMLESVLNKLSADIKTLEDIIQQKEVWEVIEERRVDELAEEGTMEASIGGVERKIVTVLRGAERERLMLNGMVQNSIAKHSLTVPCRSIASTRRAHWQRVRGLRPQQVGREHFRRALR